MLIIILPFLFMIATFLIDTNIFLSNKEYKKMLIRAEDNETKAIQILIDYFGHVNKDEKKALECFSKLEHLHHPLADIQLSALLSLDKNNTKKASVLMIRSARNGNKDAQELLCIDCKNIKYDEDELVKYYNKQIDERNKITNKILLFLGFD